MLATYWIVKNKSKVRGFQNMTFCYTFLLGAILKVANWSLGEVIYVEFSAVSDSDINTPFAAISTPVEANFFCNSTLLFSRMPSLEPAWRMRTATMCRYTGRRHCSSGCSHETVPLPNCFKIPLVTGQWASTVGLWAFFFTDYNVIFAFGWNDDWNLKEHGLRLETKSYLEAPLIGVFFGFILRFLCVFHYPFFETELVYYE